MMIFKKKDAFTLIETVVALVIAGMILSVIYYGFSLSIRITKSGNDIMVATDVAKSIFDEFLNKKKDIAIDDEYEQIGEKDNFGYKINVTNVSFNINNNFEMNLDKFLKVQITVTLNKKDYNFDFYIEK